MGEHGAAGAISERDGVRPLAASTRRAYAADLRDLVRWCEGVGHNGDLGQLDERTLFAYLAGLAREGRSRAVLQRRLRAFRAAVSAEVAGGLTTMQLRSLERRVLTGAASETAVLIVSSDPIIREGLATVLGEAGVLCWTESELGSGSVLGSWDYVLVWIEAARGIDRYGAIADIRGLGMPLTTQMPVVAVHTGPLAPVVRLRLAEAGARYAIPHQWLAAHITRISARLRAAEMPSRFHLETPLALRQLMGLELSGDLAAFLEEAARSPREVWAGHTPRSRLPITRADAGRLRQQAMGVAGIPAPEFSKYATSLRTPPSAPEWWRVRAIVREAFGIEDAPILP